MVGDLNALYRREPALWRGDYDGDGFQWIDCGDHANSVLSFLRHDRETGGHVLVVLNLTPVPHRCYRIGLPREGFWAEVLNTDAAAYGGGDLGNAGGVAAQDYTVHNCRWSAEFILPPLGVCVFRREG
jgi:1,4-alpha-glucan branching enzyme